MLTYHSHTPQSYTPLHHAYHPRPPRPLPLPNPPGSVDVCHVCDTVTVTLVISQILSQDMYIDRFSFRTTIIVSYDIHRLMVTTVRY